ncbi:hypothetical protein LY76DRAFT_230543 [Colletotrichum caudatum]|nr:hypothetical protein LY76DRAFT_230543 [Colletotrichum caudatum]
MCSWDTDTRHPDALSRTRRARAHGNRHFLDGMNARATERSDETGRSLSTTSDAQSLDVSCFLKKHATALLSGEARGASREAPCTLLRVSSASTSCSPSSRVRACLAPLPLPLPGRPVGRNLITQRLGSSACQGPRDTSQPSFPRVMPCAKKKKNRPPHGPAHRRFL